MPKKDKTKTLREQIQDALVSEVVVDDKKLDRKKFPDLDKARRSYIATERNKRVAQLRAGSAAQAFADRKAADPLVKPVAGVGENAVFFGHVQEIEGGVEIWLGDDHTVPPDYRIFNPPTLVQDPLGDVEVRGQKYREDPLGVLAEVIAGHQRTEKRSVR